MMKKIIYAILLIASFSVAIFSGVKMVNYEDVSDASAASTDDDKEEMKPTKSCDYLIEECEVQRAKDKVLNYLDGEGFYRTQDEVTIGDKIYKSIQICTIEHGYDENPFVVYNDDVSMQTAFEKMLTEENLLTDEELSKEHDWIECYENFVNSSYVKSIVQYRGGDFDFVNELATTALLICDLEGNVQDLKVIEGAFGLDIIEQDDNVCWNVYVISKMDNLLYGIPGSDYSEWVYGINYSFGDVCNMVLDANNNVTSVEFIRYSEENAGYDMVYAKTRIHNVKVYVKNKELSIKDIIDNYWYILDDTNEVRDPEYQNVINDGVKEVLGQPHYTLYGTNAMYGAYETVEGYVVAIDDDHDKIYFKKMSHDELINKKRENSGMWVGQTQNSMYEGGKLNSALEEYVD